MSDQQSWEMSQADLCECDNHIFAFLRVWCGMENRGEVDDAGGMQFSRVLAYWAYKGFPENVRIFIDRYKFDSPVDLTSEPDR